MEEEGFSEKRRVGGRGGVAAAASLSTKTTVATAETCGSLEPATCLGLTWGWQDAKHGATLPCVHRP